MIAYHINPETGNPGLCKAAQRCPFGSSEEHFPTKEDARRAYEEGQVAIAVPFVKAKVYRNGSLTPSEYEGEVREYAERADAVRPEGRPGRMGSLCASPSLKGALRWIKGNEWVQHSDRETYELTLNANTTYVYSIKAWEAYSWHRKDPSVYWDSGVLLKDYLAEPEKYDDSEWEILFHPDDIVSQRRVSKKRILDHAKDDYERDSLDTLLRRWRIK